MSKLKPADNGIRGFRPGPLLLLCTVALLISGGILFKIIRERQAVAKLSPKKAVVEEIREEISQPKPPTLHPLRGKRRIFLADGCDFRFHELTFTRTGSEQHDHPLAVLRDNDACLWDFQPVEGKKNHYRIVCADARYEEAFGKELTYTRLIDDEVPRDDTAPYLTLREDDPCEWEVRSISYQNQFELYCRSGSEPFLNESLGWMTEQEDLKKEEVTATLGRNGNPSWFILPEGQTPKTPRRVSHLIVMPRTDTELLTKARKHYEEEGLDIFRIRFETQHDKLTRGARKTNYVNLVKAIRDSDPIVGHPDFPPILSLDPTRPKEMLEAQLFPMVIPLEVTLRTHEIRKLTLENTEFWINAWDEVENFQSHLDESDIADGRVYRTENFTYFFVSWED